MAHRPTAELASSAAPSPCDRPPFGLPGEPHEPVPSADEVRVLLTGLDPLAAAVALALADSGVCLFDVNDRSRVLARDVHDGPYPAETEGLPRELALRAMLRRRSPRCVPLTAPELFPSAAVRGTVAVHAWSVAGDLEADLREPPAPAVDGLLPTLTVVTDGACVVRWPFTDWAHRPCRSCVGAAVRRARAVVRGHPLVPGATALSERAQPWCAMTRTVVAGEVTGLLLSRALGADDAASPFPAHDPLVSPGPRVRARAQTVQGLGATAGAEHPDPAGVLILDPAAEEAPRWPTLHHGLRRVPLEPDSGCLCSLSFVDP